MHGMGVWCTKLMKAGEFVHRRGVLCAELVAARKFVHERGVWCTKLQLNASSLQFYTFADEPFFLDGLKNLRKCFKKVGGAFD